MIGVIDARDPCGPSHDSGGRGYAYHALPDSRAHIAVAVALQ